MDYPSRIDLHMHSSVSDGTDSPGDLIGAVKNAGIGFFSLTDHDAVKGCLEISSLLKKGDPAFIFGVEFSCRDELGKYHILGYAYDPEAPSVTGLVDYGHSLRISKLKARLDFLKTEFGFSFAPDDVSSLFALDNPGKPHLGNLMVRYGYAANKETAISEFINKARVTEEYVRPGQAVQAILEGGGVPVLAHPFYGSGDELIVGTDMEERLKRLVDMGIRGVEAYYSGFSPKLTGEMLALAEKYSLFVTAGSDYHGSNKLVKVGDTNFATADMPRGMITFFDHVFQSGRVIRGKD